MFDRVLVANRGEIALRIFRTLRAMGVASVAVYAEGDRDAPHVAGADMAVSVPGYLDVDGVVAAAVAAGADGLHPGYGFLSESAALAEACQRAGVIFVGPPAQAMEVMGDKINAKLAVAAAGVPVVPGRLATGMDDDALIEAALEIGLPVVLKPSAGGGGKGMRVVTDADRLPAEMAASRREATAAFGDGTLLVERWVARPRHVEIQVFADAHGQVVHLGERECSLQRRHQKIVEESPSPLVGGDTRLAMGAAAVDAAKSVGYVGAGTVEFIVSAERPDEYFFLEMNTRLQVEHPVTEAVTGLDLVEWQLRVAAGEPLGFDQADICPVGHAVEARIYAEDPARGFLPTGGRVRLLREPAGLAGVRVDSGLAEGAVIGTAYDPLLAKVVAHGADRAQALQRLDAALAATTVLGVTTNVGFLRRLLAHPDVAAGRLDTGLVERELDGLVPPVAPDEAFAAAGLALACRLEPTGPFVDPWDIPGGWRLGEPAPARWELTIGGRTVAVAVTGRPSEGAVVRVGDADGFPASARLTRVGDADGFQAQARLTPEGLEVAAGGRLTRWDVAFEAGGVWVGRAGDAWAVGCEPRRRAGASALAGRGGPVTSPMPGTVRRVLVEAGQAVVAGQELVVVEAMKMEYAVTAPVAGTVATVHVQEGEQVALDQPLADVDAGDQSLEASP